MLPLFTVLAITILVLLLNYPIVATIWQYSFDDGTYSHAYIIPIISFYLYYLLSRSGDLLFRTAISWPLIVILALSGYFVFVAANSQISILYWLALLTLLCSSISTLFKTNLKVLFPTLFFIFLLPMWGALSIPLQSISVIAVNALMKLTTIPVYVEQQFVHIPAGTFEIAGGCSGLRYLLTSLTISTLYSFLYLRKFKHILIFGTFAILGALLTNWLRIAVLIIIGQETNMTSSLMADHNMFGWYFYIPFMFLLFKLGDKLTKNTSIKNKKTASVEHSQLNGKIVLITVVILIASSTSLKAYLTDNSINNIENQSLKSLSIKPQIPFYSSVDIIDASPKNVNLIFHFNNIRLDNKPTFFDINLIPAGWAVESQTINQQFTIYKLTNGRNKANLTVGYEINQQIFPTTTQFKLQRIKYAFFGISKTKLHWHFNLFNKQGF
jgi:exosortase A